MFVMVILEISFVSRIPGKERRNLTIEMFKFLKCVYKTNILYGRMHSRFSTGAIAGSRLMIWFTFCRRILFFIDLTAQGSTSTSGCSLILNRFAMNTAHPMPWIVVKASWKLRVWKVLLQLCCLARGWKKAPLTLTNIRWTSSVVGLIWIFLAIL